MSQQVVVPARTLEKLGKLADLLEQASGLARDISRAKKAGLSKIPNIKRPKRVSKDQEWLKGEKEVNEDLKKGRYEVFDNVNKMIKDLHSRA